MNEHIEYFQRFSKCYLMWSHSNFDRIASDAARKHLAAHIEEREEVKRQESPLYTYWEMTKDSRKHFYDSMAKSLIGDNVFLCGSQWDDELKIGSTLKIRLPSVGTSAPSACSAPIPLSERARSWLKLFRTKR